MLITFADKGLHDAFVNCFPREGKPESEVILALIKSVRVHGFADQQQALAVLHYLNFIHAKIDVPEDWSELVWALMNGDAEIQVKYLPIVSVAAAAGEEAGVESEGDEDAPSNEDNVAVADAAGKADWRQRIEGGLGRMRRGATAVAHHVEREVVEAAVTAKRAGQQAKATLGASTRKLIAELDSLELPLPTLELHQLRVFMEAHPALAIKRATGDGDELMPLVAAYLSKNTQFSREQLTRILSDEFFSVSMTEMPGVMNWFDRLHDASLVEAGRRVRPGVVYWQDFLASLPVTHVTLRVALLRHRLNLQNRSLDSEAHLEFHIRKLSPLFDQTLSQQLALEVVKHVLFEAGLVPAHAVWANQLSFYMHQFYRSLADAHDLPKPALGEGEEQGMQDAMLPYLKSVPDTFLDEFLVAHINDAGALLNLVSSGWLADFKVEHQLKDRYPGFVEMLGDLAFKGAPSEQVSGRQQKDPGLYRPFLEVVESLVKVNAALAAYLLSVKAMQLGSDKRFGLIYEAVLSIHPSDERNRLRMLLDTLESSVIAGERSHLAHFLQCHYDGVVKITDFPAGLTHLFNTPGAWWGVRPESYPGCQKKLASLVNAKSGVSSGVPWTFVRFNLPEIYQTQPAALAEAAKIPDFIQCYRKIMVSGVDANVHLDVLDAVFADFSQLEVAFVLQEVKVPASAPEAAKLTALMMLRQDDLKRNFPVAIAFFVRLCESPISNYEQRRDVLIRCFDNFAVDRFDIVADAFFKNLDGVTHDMRVEFAQIMVSHWRDFALVSECAVDLAEKAHEVFAAVSSGQKAALGAMLLEALFKKAQFNADEFGPAILIEKDDVVDVEGGVAAEVGCESLGARRRGSTVSFPAFVQAPMFVCEDLVDEPEASEVEGLGLGGPPQEVGGEAEVIPEPQYNFDQFLGALVKVCKEQFGQGDSHTTAIFEEMKHAMRFECQRILSAKPASIVELIQLLAVPALLKLNVRGMGDEGDDKANQEWVRFMSLVVSLQSDGWLQQAPFVQYCKDHALKSKKSSGGELKALLVSGGCLAGKTLDRAGLVALRHLLRFGQATMGAGKSSELIIDQDAPVLASSPKPEQTGLLSLARHAVVVGGRQRSDAGGNKQAMAAFAAARQGGGRATGAPRL